ncbi:hypothetical protein [Sorangium sp. So ce385]|uniref:hypothetical protein n=1 Tax=Sorangium sp. So ce385 TaxID=3133308 RepID=UPI003F5BFD15
MRGFVSLNAKSEDHLSGGLCFERDAPSEGIEALPQQQLDALAPMLWHRQKPTLPFPEWVVRCSSTWARGAEDR